MRNGYRKPIEEIDWDGITPWAELRTNDTEQLITDLIAYKQSHFPTDLRPILAIEVIDGERLRVLWSEPENVVKTVFTPASNKDHSPSQSSKNGSP